MKNQCVLASYGSLDKQVSSIGTNNGYITSFSLFSYKPYIVPPYSGKYNYISVIGDSDTNYSKSIIGKEISIVKGSVIKILSQIG